MDKQQHASQLSRFHFTTILGSLSHPDQNAKLDPEVLPAFTASVKNMNKLRRERDQHSQHGNQDGGIVTHQFVRRQRRRSGGVNVSQRRGRTSSFYSCSSVFLLFCLILLRPFHDELWWHNFFGMVVCDSGGLRIESEDSRRGSLSVAVTED